MIAFTANNNMVGIIFLCFMGKAAVFLPNVKDKGLQTAASVTSPSSSSFEVLKKGADE